MTDRKKLLKDSVDQISPNQTPKREYSSTISSHEPQTPIRKNRISGWPLKSVTPRYRKRIEVLCLVLAVVVVLGLFAIPIAFHIKQLTETNGIIFDNDNHCTTKENHYVFNETCEEFSWSESPSADNSSFEVYDGNVCKDFLEKWQECATGRQGTVSVCPAQKQKETEVLAAKLFTAIDAIDSSQCQKAIHPFLCQYLFPLCGQRNYLPSKEECFYVSTVACEKEYDFVRKYVPKISLPNCEYLPSETYPKNASLPMLNSSTFACSPEFYNQSNFCFPSCHNFKESSKQTSLAMKIIEIWSGWFALIVAAIVLVLSLIRYKSMFTIPSVFLVYMTICFGIMALFVVITFFDQKGLYCSSQDLAHSIEHPSQFCTISGAVFHYCLVGGTIWWFFHVSLIFYKLMFPLRAKRTEKYDKYIHVVLLIIGLLLPSPAVIYVLTRSKYILVQFPPLLCVPKGRDLWYYSTLLVLNVLTAVGACMFVPMFWVVHKHQGIFRTKTGGLSLSVAERKILFVLCYYVLFGVVGLTYFGISTWEQDKFISATLEYFGCNLLGDHNKCTPCFQKYSHPWIEGLCYVSLSFIPVANFIFVVNWKEVGIVFDRLKAKAFPSEPRHVLDIDHSALSPYPESRVVNNIDLESDYD